MFNLNILLEISWEYIQINSSFTMRKTILANKAGYSGKSKVKTVYNNCYFNKFQKNLSFKISFENSNKKIGNGENILQLLLVILTLYSAVQTIINYISCYN